MGTAGLTCPQAATYRGSVGVEPAVSCCAPEGPLFVGVMLTGFWVGVQDLHHGADLPVDLSTIVIE